MADPTDDGGDVYHPLLVEVLLPLLGHYLVLVEDDAEALLEGKLNQELLYVDALKFGLGLAKLHLVVHTEDLRLECPLLVGHPSLPRNMLFVGLVSLVQLVHFELRGELVGLIKRLDSLLFYDLLYVRSQLVFGGGNCVLCDFQLQLVPLEPSLQGLKVVNGPSELR